MDLLLYTDFSSELLQCWIDLLLSLLHELLVGFRLIIHILKSTALIYILLYRLDFPEL
ncbi:hypothetical protein BJX61DRAFT_495051, partial [Aspergillus egyptiacus]